jgi:hypothetical protein
MGAVRNGADPTRAGVEVPGPRGDDDVQISGRKIRFFAR